MLARECPKTHNFVMGEINDPQAYDDFLKSLRTRHGKGTLKERSVELEEIKEKKMMKLLGVAHSISAISEGDMLASLQTLFDTVWSDERVKQGDFSMFPKGFEVHWTDDPETESDETIFSTAPHSKLTGMHVRNFQIVDACEFTHDRYIELFFPSEFMDIRIYTLEDVPELLDVHPLRRTFILDDQWPRFEIRGEDEYSGFHLYCYEDGIMPQWYEGIDANIDYWYEYQSDRLIPYAQLVEFDDS